MPTFGLIAEGPADLNVLENILVGYFDDQDLDARHLQPLRDATDANYAPGGWTRVLEYCTSSFFFEAFSQNDFLVIQLDTDRLNEKPFELDLSLPAEELRVQVIEKLLLDIQTAFGNEFIRRYGNSILFAISVHAMECWLLPLYVTGKDAQATNNCLYKLNQYLAKQNMKTINPASKDPKLYNKLSIELCKRKKLMLCSSKNPSFSLFMDSLNEALPYSE